ncbi:MAG TPA: hypothetical protein VFQ47_09825 [Nitrososphaera sp.]|nr:hypothetical protein [Nitrososphaera sp.]
MEKTLGVEDSIPKTIIKLSYKKRCILLQQQCKKHTRIRWSPAAMRAQPPLKGKTVNGDLGARK